MRSWTALIAFAVAASLLVLPTVASANCETKITYDPAITAPGDHANGFPGRQITTPEIVSYFGLVGEQSDRVITGSFGTSIGGVDLVYSLVSSPENLARVDQIAADQDKLRDPRVTSPEEAALIADETPAIVWYTGNVHGNEPSGADAATTILHELAARSDCDATLLLDELVIGILPTQNPDGRTSNTRTNRYGFDMNRDWFAGSQPESAGKLELLKAYPPVLYIDAHQMGGTEFFFPPNADPIHHEISEASVDWINNLYGRAMQDEFDRRAEEAGPTSQSWDYFNYNVYDLFYMGYGDTMPSTAYGAAGMTFEKGSSDPASQRHIEQFVAGWTSMMQTAANKDAVLARHYDSHVQALADGRDGVLEDNLVVEPQNSVEFEVPEQTVRHYFLLPDSSGEGNMNRLVDRLQRTAVEIHRLDAPLELTDAKRYGRDSGAITIPEGAYWIPMEQPQKRWIQALLGEDPYTPFPYFYDVTAWSNPLLMDVTAVIAADELVGVDATLMERRQPQDLSILPAPDLFSPLVWWDGDTADGIAAAMHVGRAASTNSVHRATTALTLADGQTIPAGSFMAIGDTLEGLGLDGLVAQFPITLHASADRDAAERAPAFTTPKIAVFNGGGESGSHLRFMLDQVWKLDYDSVAITDVIAGNLTAGGYDVFLVPGVTASTLVVAAPQIQLFVQQGGTYIGTNRGAQGGTSLATQIGLTTARSTPLAGAEVGGTAFRADVEQGPATMGSPDGEAFWFNLGDNVLSESLTGTSPVTYSEGEDFWFSGYGTGVDSLAGTSVVVHEAAGTGNVVLFSGEPNYRAYTEGPSFLLLNAMLLDGLADQPADVTNVFSLAAAADIAAARAAGASASAADKFGAHRPITLRVDDTDLAAARALLSTFTADLAIEPAAAGGWLLRIPNPDGLDFESHPFVYQLRHAFEEADIPLLSALF